MAEEKELDPTRFIPMKVMATKDTPVGFETETLVKKWTLDKGRLYSNRFAPWPRQGSFHTSYPEAEVLGFHAPVEAGLQELEHLGEFMIKFFGENFVGGTLTAAFRGLMFPDDEMFIKGVVKERIPEGDAVKLVLDIQAVDKNGNPVISATGSGLVR